MTNNWLSARRCVGRRKIDRILKTGDRQRRSLASSLTVLEPPPARVPVTLRALWEYREVLYFLIWRDLKVRYRQTAIGATWAIIQPLMTMVVFTIFFGRLAKMPSDGVPYPLFAFVALVPWTFFANGLSQGASS